MSGLCPARLGWRCWALVRGFCVSGRGLGMRGYCCVVWGGFLLLSAVENNLCQVTVAAAYISNSYYFSSYDLSLQVFCFSCEFGHRRALAHKQYGRTSGHFNQSVSSELASLIFLPHFSLSHLPLTLLFEKAQIESALRAHDSQRLQNSESMFSFCFFSSKPYLLKDSGLTLFRISISQNCKIANLYVPVFSSYENHIKSCSTN